MQRFRSCEFLNYRNIHVNEKGKRSIVHLWSYEGWNFNSGNYLFTTDTK